MRLDQLLQFIDLRKQLFSFQPFSTAISWRRNIFRPPVLIQPTRMAESALTDFGGSMMIPKHVPVGGQLVTPTAGSAAGLT